MNIDDIYARFKQSGLDKMHLGPADVQPILNSLLLKKTVHGEKLGESFNRQSVCKFRFGYGPICILAWSQMHGNEPTATASLIDFMQFLLTSEGSAWQASWQDKISLHILPMLNPDGAENNTRVNAQGIDINRDAAVLQSPEGRILHNLLNTLKPDVAFNLHDQNRYYTVGEKGPATVLAFMAPPADIQKTITPARKKAMQIIDCCVERSNHYIKGKIARYDDTYSNRAFGDYAASLGAACILIESGTEAGDPNRQIARKMNFLSLFESIERLSTNSLHSPNIDAYNALPMNYEDGMADVILRGLNIGEIHSKQYWVDVNIQLDLSLSTGTLIEVGDLARVKGYFEFGADKLNLISTTCFTLDSPLTLTKEKYMSLISEGYLGFRGNLKLLVNNSGFPVEFSQSLNHDASQLTLNQNATFAMGIGDKIRYVVVKGIVIDVAKQIAINGYTY